MNILRCATVLVKQPTFAQQDILTPNYFLAPLPLNVFVELDIIPYCPCLCKSYYTFLKGHFRRKLVWFGHLPIGLERNAK